MLGYTAYTKLIKSKAISFIHFSVPVNYIAKTFATCVFLVLKKKIDSRGMMCVRIGVINQV